MHLAAYRYIKEHVQGRTFARILDIGALDVNSTAQGLSLRALFPNADYYGIDEQAGGGVDEAVSARDYNGKAGFDLVLSTEAMEHTEHPEDIVACAWRALVPGGVLLVTCAGHGRERHNCDGGPYTGVEWYLNIDPNRLRVWLADWTGVGVQHNANLGDVYAMAVKPKQVNRGR